MMGLERQKADLGDLAEEFLEDDPQQGTGTFSSKHLYDQIDRMNADELPNVDFPAEYEDDVILGGDSDEPGPLDTEFIDPAPSQTLYADEEPGGMFGSTADELLGGDGPDSRDLGSTEGDFSRVARTFEAADPQDTLVETAPGRNIDSASGQEDLLATDLPIGGTYGDMEEVVDPETGELSDYDSI